MTDNQRKKIGPRLKEVRLTKKMTLKQFYSPVSEHVNNFSPIENGKRSIGKRVLEQVLQVHNINREWVETGIGEMFNEAALYEETSYIQEPGEGVPFININPAQISSGQFNILREKPEYYVNFRPFNDCDAYLPVYGDSMYPKYASGEIIAVREVNNKDIIQWGEAYLIIGDEFANNITTVKLLFEHHSDSKIVLRGSNPNFKGDTVLDRQAIKRLFIVKGKITRNQL